MKYSVWKVDVDVDGVYERMPKPLCPHLDVILSLYNKLRY